MGFFIFSSHDDKGHLIKRGGVGGGGENIMPLTTDTMSTGKDMIE